MSEMGIRPPRAALRLLLATAAWGMSFPAAKAVMLAQAELLPGRADWFHAALVLMNRMLLAAALMGGMFWRNLRKVRGQEMRQGIELGVCGGLGMLLQTDAQNVIPASTSAFFTQFTCIFVPLIVALHSRRLPTKRVCVACVLVLVGCAVLSGVRVDGVGFRIGEWETILGAALFTAQILGLERGCYRGNDMRSTATVMFLVKGILFLPVVILGAMPGAAGDWQQVSVEFARLYQNGPVMLMTVLLTVYSTVYGYATMTRWQTYVSATRAGLIYATEPIFATIWALFIPGLFSRLAGISYANERITVSFLVGAVLILCANLLLMREPKH